MYAIAHRGGTEQFAENTLSAIRSSVAHVDRVELDVRRCGSGELVVFRHASTAELTDGDFEVAETDLETLRGLSVLGTGEGIPTLADALAEVPSEVDVQLDLKVSGIAPDAKRVADRYDHEVYFCSTDPDLLSEASALADDVAVGYVSFAHFQEEGVDPGSVPEAERREAIETATRLDSSFVEIPYALCLETDVVDAAHDAGLDVVAWPIRTREQLDAAATRGVNAAMVDRVDIL